MDVKTSRKYLSFLIMFSALLAGAGSAEARQRGDFVPGSRYVSARGAALGDAFLPLADDGASALFYNPAAIARLRKTQLEPVNMQLEANTESVSMVNRNAYKMTSLSGYQPELGAKPGKRPGLGGSFFPNFFTRGIAFGILYNTKLSATENNGVVSYRSLYQLIPAIGTGIRLASGVVRIGYTFQWVQQASGDVSVPAASSPLGYNQMLYEGSAPSHNLGLAVTLPVQYLPSFNAVVRNVFGAHYRNYTLFAFAKNPAGLPPDDPMTIDVSASIQPKVATGAFFNVVLEYRDVTNTSGMSWLGRFASGLEFSFRDQFFARAGWGSGYVHAGGGLRRKTAELSFSWTADEYGNGYHKLGDRRFVLQYQFRAF